MATTLEGEEARFKTALKTIYVAGRLTPRSNTMNHAIEHLVNMRHMITVGRRLLMAGYYPFIPAFDFLFFIIPPEKDEISASQIKEYSMEWLRRCDAVLFLPGWSKSEGAVAEFHEAKSLRLPMFFDIEDLLEVGDNAIP